MVARVGNDAYPFARERIAQLIASTWAAVGQIQPHEQGADSTALFKAAWSASQAAGFIEAFALIDPVLAGEMLAEFESVGGLVQRLRAPGRAANDSTHGDRGASERRLGERPPSVREHLVDRRLAGSIRRLAVRRVMADRRNHDRRQLPDRRGC